MTDYAERQFWKLIDRKRINDGLTRNRRTLDRRDARPDIFRNALSRTAR